MMTNLFHKDPSLKGINFQKVNETSFIAHLAFVENDKLKVKCLTFQGDSHDEMLIKRIKDSGVLMGGDDEIPVMFSSVFSN